MDQFESEALRLATGIFFVFCVAFCILRRKLVFWSLLPRIVMYACLGWIVSSLIVITTLRTSAFEGLLFAFAYFAVVLMTPPLLAAGMLEIVLGIYAIFMKRGRTISFSARSHFIAALSTFTCIGAYIVLSQFSK